uniref:Ionotropic glutamate receptor C-terminal domain-containing protein n=1 Tax=Tetranychus urticae TaxID=32264 RepID=T1KT68_TETUR
MIIVTSEETVNTLRDVVNQRKTPIFINGLSEHELFRLGVTKDFRDVFKLAMEKGSPDQFSASLELFAEFNSEYVILTSTKIRLIVDAMDYLLRPDRSFLLHWSDRTYHKVNQAYLVTASPVKVNVKNRLMVMISRLQQSHIFDTFQERAITDIIKDFNLSLHKIFRLQYRSSNTYRGNTKKFYSPLSSAGFQSIRRYFFNFIALSIGIFAIECLFRACNTVQ